MTDYNIKPPLERSELVRQPGECRPGQCPACDSTAAQPRARTLAELPVPDCDTCNRQYAELGIDSADIAVPCPHPEPYKPRVGERARLKSSPCAADESFVGQVIEIVGIDKQRNQCSLWYFKDKLEKERAAHAAELERLRDDRDKAECSAEDLRLKILNANDYVKELRAELAAARAERPMPTDEDVAWQLVRALGSVPGDWTWRDLSQEGRNYWMPYARAAKAALLGVRREGPTREQVEQTVFDHTPGVNELGDCRETASAVLALFGAEPKGQPEPTLEAIVAALDKVYGERHADRAPVAARAVLALFQQDSAGTPGPRSSLENTGASATGGAGSNPDGGRPAETTDTFAGMPLPWRERIELLERLTERQNDEITKHTVQFGLTDLRCGALERAVEGLRGGGS